MICDMTYAEEQKHKVRNRYFRRQMIPEIARTLSIRRQMLYKRRNYKSRMIDRPDEPEILIRRRLTDQIQHEKGNALELHEFDWLLHIWKSSSGSATAIRTGKWLLLFGKLCNRPRRFTVTSMSTNISGFRISNTWAPL